ncbi:MAG: glycine cleavage system aminomethyltransferase GcvT [bacterium]
MNTDNLNRTALFEDYPDDPPLMGFGGWEMPRDFGGIVEEHRTVREDCGVFDLSHMGRLVLSGEGAAEQIDSLFTRSFGQAEPGQALYGFFCNEEGGCLDDAILYYQSDSKIWMVVNAANRVTIVDWIESHVDTSLDDRTFDTVLLAVQGPDAPKVLQGIDVLNVPDTPFRTNWNGNSMAASTGYTGEAGGELWLDIETGKQAFNQLLDDDVRPCGLGARDTLRLEQGFPLHGHELSHSIDPVTAGLEHFIDWDGTFVGKESLTEIKEKGPDETITGIMTNGRQSPRQGYSIRQGDGSTIGEVTSGGFSPILERGIGMVKIDASTPESAQLEMELRGSWSPVEQKDPPFV